MPVRWDDTGACKTDVVECMMVREGRSTACSSLNRAFLEIVDGQLWTISTEFQEIRRIQATARSIATAFVHSGRQSSGFVRNLSAILPPLKQQSCPAHDVPPTKKNTIPTGPTDGTSASSSHWFPSVRPLRTLSHSNAAARILMLGSLAGIVATCIALMGATGALRSGNRAQFNRYLRYRVA